jgi:hypothetical protein
MKSKTFKLFLILSIAFLYGSKDAIAEVYTDKKERKDTTRTTASAKIEKDKDSSSRKRTRIVYDFNKKEVVKDRLTRVKENGEVQVEINNFNQLRYLLSVQDSSFNIFTSDPDKFLEKIYLIKSYPRKSLEQEQSKDSSGNKSTDYGKSEKKAIQPYSLTESAKDSYNSYVKFFNAFKNINSIYSYACQLEVLNKNSIASLVKDNFLSRIYSKEPFSIYTIFSGDIQTKHDELFCEVKEIRNKIQLTIEYKENKTKDIDEDISKIKTNIQLYKGATKNKSLEKEEDSLIKKENEKDAIVTDIYNLKQIMSPLSELIKMVDTSSRYINESLDKYSQIQNALKTPSFYVSESYRVTKDIHCLNIYKYDMNTKKSSKHDKITIELKNALRFSTPSGVFLTGLYDEKFTTVSKDTTIETVVINSSGISEKAKSNKTYTAMYPSRNRHISFGAMIYISAHTCNSKYTNIGGFLGAGAIFNDNTKIAAAAGGTIILGRNQRCFINIGMATSQVDRLDRPYKTKTFYDINPSTLPISKVWRYSWMVGVAWEIIK